MFAGILKGVTVRWYLSTYDLCSSLTWPCDSAELQTEKCATLPRKYRFGSNSLAPGVAGVMPPFWSCDHVAGFSRPHRRMSPTGLIGWPPTPKWFK